MREHTKLRALELADALALLVYALTREFPRDEMFVLTSQGSRAGVSIASNIEFEFHRSLNPLITSIGPRTGWAVENRLCKTTVACPQTNELFRCGFKSTGIVVVENYRVLLAVAREPANPANRAIACSSFAAARLPCADCDSTNAFNSLKTLFRYKCIVSHELHHYFRFIAGLARGLY